MDRPSVIKATIVPPARVLADYAECPIFDQWGETVIESSTERRAEDARLLRESLGLLAPVAPQLVTAFYDQLFAEHPDVRSMFPEEMDPQCERLLAAIVALATHYDEPEQLIPALTTMGRNHARYRAELVHYAAVGEALMTVLRRFAGQAWNAQYEGAWLRAYTFAAGTMMAASALAPRAEEPLAA
jgi:methyl-accepting chemotaxis protein